jgi:hypothetical protein
MTRALVKDIPQHEQPLSERYRLAANAWVKADAVARRYEELKSTRLEQMKNALILKDGPMPDNRAEREIKASDEWERYIIDMVDARTRANELKVQIVEIQMLEREQQDRNQTIRAEMRMAR